MKKIITLILSVCFLITGALTGLTEENRASVLGFGVVKKAVISPDGKFLAIKSSAGIAVLDVDTNSLVIEFPSLEEDKNDLSLLVFSGDGKKLWMQNNVLMEMVCWDISGKKKIYTIPLQKFQPLSFSPDNKFLLAGKLVIEFSSVYDGQSGDFIRTINFQTKTHEDILSISCDNNYFADMDIYKRIVNLYRFSDGGFLNEIQIKLTSDEICYNAATAFSADSSALFVFTRDNVYKYSCLSNETILQFPVHGYKILSIDGSLIVNVSKNKVNGLADISLYNSDSGKFLRSFQGPAFSDPLVLYKDSIISLSKDNRRLSILTNNTVEIWDIQEEQKIADSSAGYFTNYK